MIILLRKTSVKWLIALLAAVLIFSAVKGRLDERTTEDVEPTAVVMAQAVDQGETLEPADSDDQEPGAPASGEEQTPAANEEANDEEPAPTAPAATEEETAAADAAQAVVALRMERSQNRAQQAAQLEEIIANESISEATRGEAEEKLLRLNEQSALELSAETMLKTKGYEQSVVLIDFDKATVYIKAELAAADFDKIGDLIQTATNFSLEQIIIIPK